MFKQNYPYSIGNKSQRLLSVGRIKKAGKQGYH